MYKTSPVSSKVYGTWYLLVDTRNLQTVFHSLNMFVEGLLCHSPMLDMEVGIKISLQGDHSSRRVNVYLKTRGKGKDNSVGEIIFFWFVLFCSDK